MSLITDKVSSYVKEQGINIAKMSRETNIPYMALYNSLVSTERSRDLRDEEFLKVCAFLEVDPRNFANRKGEKNGRDTEGAC